MNPHTLKISATTVEVAAVQLVMRVSSFDPPDEH